MTSTDKVAELRDFVLSLAESIPVNEEFQDGNAVFNEVVMDARQLCDQLKIRYTAPEKAWS